MRAMVRVLVLVVSALVIPHIALAQAVIAGSAGLQTSNINFGSPYCNVSSGFLTQFRGLASYVIPVSSSSR